MESLVHSSWDLVNPWDLQAAEYICICHVYCICRQQCMCYCTVLCVLCVRYAMHICSLVICSLLKTNFSRPATTGYLIPTLQRQNTKISKQLFPEKEYRGLSPKIYIHGSVSDLCIPTIGLPILLEEICRPILGLYKSLTDT